MHVSIRRVNFEFRSPFRIAYRTRTHAQAVWLEIEHGGLVGRGEALGVSYRGETADSLCDQLSDFAAQLQAGITRTDLQSTLPAGGARHAIDCALWDLEAKQRGRRVWELMGLKSVRPLLSAYTLGIDTPESMAKAAAAVKQYPLLKVKLNGESDLQRVAAIRAARPEADLIVDANQSWTEEQLYELAPRFCELGVKLIEQPLPAGKDQALAAFKSPVPLCADESFQTSESICDVKGKYDYVNIKLDKTGGFTEGLRAMRIAEEHGLKLMVGCMGGSSLSMAPAFVVGQFCEVVDVDGPLLLKSDVEHAVRYEGSRMLPPEASLWG